MTGQIFLQTAEVSVGETDGTVFVAIERTGDASSAVNVQYSTTNISAGNGDYVNQSGTVTIPAGQSRVLVPISILDDALSEATEEFSFNLVNVDSGSLLFPRTTRVSILDDENPVTDPPNPPSESNYNVTEDAVFTGLTQPIAIEWLPNNSNIAFVAEQTGVIHVYNTTTGDQLPTLLDLTDQVNNRQDRGLLDIAIHPDVQNNPYLYAFYTVDPPGVQGNTGNAGPDGGGNRFSHLVRFELDAASGYTSVVPGSETILVGAAGQTLSDISGNGAIDSTSNLTIRDSEIDPNTGDYIQDYLKIDSRSHVGGSIEFGPDGALYVSTGDGTSFNATDSRTVSVQDVNSLAGKILRIDPITGEGLSDNPFFTGDADANASKVYQLGLRNPFSMSFDVEGRLLITDTGWNAYEEINSGGPGANFGWPFYEGGDNGQLVEANGYRDLPEGAAFYAAVSSGAIEVTPAFRAFSHNSNDPGFQLNAITGADDLIDSALYPDSLQNHYIFTDVTQGEIYVVDANDRRNVELLYETDGFAPVHFKQGPDGSIWFADVVTGRVGRLNITERGEGDLSVDYFAIPSTTTSVTQIDFDGAPIASETVNAISEDAGTGAFYSGGPVDDFAARYRGEFTADSSGNYTFYLTSDDGSRLFVDGQLVIKNDGLQPATEDQATINLSAGTHTIEVQYFERGGQAVLDLDWSGPGFGRTQMVFEGSGSGNVISGTSGADFLVGTDADETYIGNGGADVFSVSGGNDIIIGDAGEYDQIDTDGFASQYTFVQNADGTVAVTGPGLGVSTLSSVEGVWFRGEAAWYSIDSLIDQGPGGNTITGTSGDDVLFGTVADETYVGNGGQDVFSLSGGNDTILGDAGQYDQINTDGFANQYSFAENNDGTVTVTGPGIGVSTLTSIEGVWFRGEFAWYSVESLIDTGGSNVINGTSGDDVLFGTGADETYIGNGGQDVFSLSGGNDTILGDAGVYSQINTDGFASDYNFVRNADGTVTVTGPGVGTNTLSEIDGVWFRNEEAWYSIDSLVS